MDGNEEQSNTTTGNEIIYDSMAVEIRYDGFSCRVNTAVNKKTVLCEINNTQ